MDTEELLKYEMPIIAEFISIGWIQTIVAKYVAWKVHNKLIRYRERKEREVFILQRIKERNNDKDSN